MEIKTLEFGGLLSALQALRLPFGKDSRSHLKTTEKEDVLLLIAMLVRLAMKMHYDLEINVCKSHYSAMVYLRMALSNFLLLSHSIRAQANP